MAKTTYLLLALFTLAGCNKPENPPQSQPKPKAEAPAPAGSAQAATPQVQLAKVEQPAKPDPNKELAQRVKQALEGQAKIQAGGIDVSAADGVVTLWGTATTAGERDRAARAAARVDGVKSVTNKIAVVKGS
jgi:hyperosmotically inducible periplasmic protein